MRFCGSIVNTKRTFLRRAKFMAAANLSLLFVASALVAAGIVALVPILAALPEMIFTGSQAQIYVSMGCARQTMHLITDSIAASREAVCRRSKRESAIEIMDEQAPNPCPISSRNPRRGH